MATLSATSTKTTTMTGCGASVSDQRHGECYINCNFGSSYCIEVNSIRGVFSRDANTRCQHIRAVVPHTELGWLFRPTGGSVDLESCNGGLFRPPAALGSFGMQARCASTRTGECYRVCSRQCAACIAVASHYCGRSSPAWNALARRRLPSPSTRAPSASMSYTSRETHLTCY